MEAVRKKVTETPSSVNSPQAAGETFLSIAVIDNYDPLIRWLLTHGADINLPSGKWGQTPLHAAVIMDRTANARIVKLLIANGANVNAPDSYGDTPLHKAATFADPKIVRLLLRAGANPNARAARGETPLHYAAREKFDTTKDRRPVISQLLKSGGNINIQDSNGATPIHGAVIIGNSEMVEYLLEHGAAVDAKNIHGMTPLHVAAAFGQNAVARVLLAHHANPNERSADGLTPIGLALKAPAISYDQNGKRPVDVSKVIEVIRNGGGV